MALGRKRGGGEDPHPLIPAQAGRADRGETSPPGRHGRTATEADVGEALQPPQVLRHAVPGAKTMVLQLVHQAALPGEYRTWGETA